MLIIGGDPSTGFEGLVQMQKKDEDYKREVTDVLSKISNSQDQLHAEQKKMSTELGKHDERLKSLEGLVAFVQTLGSVKKKTIAVILAVISAIGYGIMNLHTIIELIKPTK